MAAFTTTAVERFVKAGVPAGKPHATLQGRERPLPAVAAFWIERMALPITLVGPAD